MVLITKKTQFGILGFVLFIFAMLFFTSSAEASSTVSLAKKASPLESPAAYIEYLENYSTEDIADIAGASSKELIDNSREALKQFTSLSKEEQEKYLSIMRNPEALSAMISGDTEQLGELSKYVSVEEDTKVTYGKLNNVSAISDDGTLAITATPTRTITHSGTLSALGIKWTGYKITGKYEYNSSGVTNALKATPVITHHYNPTIDTDLSWYDKYVSSKKFYGESVFSYKVGIFELGLVQIGNVYLNVAGDKDGKLWGQFYTKTK